MRKVIAGILIMCCMLCGLPLSASAEFDWEAYSLDELLEIQNGLSQVVAEKQRQYAIEHGDRKILLQDEQLVYVGGSVTLEPGVEKVIDTAPDSTSFVWSSSNEEIATVSSSGTVRGVAKGDAVITCMASDNEFIFAEVKVNSVLPVSGLAINEETTDVLMYEGENNTLQLTYSVTPEDAYCQEVEWLSGDDSIATVDESGLVTLVKPGRVTIKTKSLDEFSASYPKEARKDLNVLQAASTLELDQNNIVMNMGTSVSLKPTIMPESTSDKSVVWESSDPEIVTVSSGQLRAVSCGKATVTCTAADGSGVNDSCEVEVIQMVTGIKILDMKYPLTLDMNSTMKLETVISPDYATDKNLIWTSSDSNVVSVSEAGEITALSGGTATITCTAADGSEKTAGIEVFVPSIAVEAEEYVVTSKSGMTFDVSFYGVPENFEITSSSSSYYDVSYDEVDGVISVEISPKKAGEAYITLKDKADSKNNRNVTIVIDHSAVYDKVSYPQANYTDIMRNPKQHEDKTYSIYGKVLQVMDGGFYGVARVGTTGYGYYDNVFYITFYPFLLDTNIIEDDMVTIYGECTGTYTYETVMGASITLPALTADKIVLGAG